MKLKSILFATLALSAMGQAMATVAPTTADSTLVLMVGDQNHSYLFDTGVSMASVIAGTANASFVLPNWSQYNIAASTPFDPASGAGTRWALLGGTFASLGNVQSLVITGTMDGLNDGSLDIGNKNSAVKQDAQKLFGYADSVATSLAANTNVVNSSADAYANDAIFNLGYGFQLNYQGVTAGGLNQIGMYYESLSSPTKASIAANFAQLAETATLDTTTGTLTIAAAVPEPSSYALLLAGLAAIGFVSRRRQRD